MNSALSLLPLLLLASIVIVWQILHSFNERAVAIARESCREAGLQLLDATVSLSRLRLSRQNQALAWVLDYGFDVSADGHTRAHGRMRFIGGALEWIDLPRGPDGSDLWM